LGNRKISSEKDFTRICKNPVKHRLQAADLSASKEFDMNRAAHLSCLSLILVVFLLVCTAWAQYGASLQGTVTDQSGAVVSGANVTATNEATGLSRG